MFAPREWRILAEMANTAADPRQAKQIAGIIAICAVVLNVAFHFLANAYYADRAATYGMASPEAMSSARIAFAVMTATVAATAIAALFAPRAVAHGLASVVALVAIVGAVLGATKFHPVLPVALGLLGVLMLVLVYFSLQAKSRASWAFLTATCAVGGLVTLFGATKVRNAIDIPLFYALILPGILIVATVMLVQVADEYAE